MERIFIYPTKSCLTKTIIYNSFFLLASILYFFDAHWSSKFLAISIAISSVSVIYRNYMDFIVHKNSYIEIMENRLVLRNSCWVKKVELIDVIKIVITTNKYIEIYNTKSTLIKTNPLTLKCFFINTKKDKYSFKCIIEKDILVKALRDKVNPVKLEIRS